MQAPAQPPACLDAVPEPSGGRPPVYIGPVRLRIRLRFLRLAPPLTLGALGLGQILRGRAVAESKQLPEVDQAFAGLHDSPARAPQTAWHCPRIEPFAAL